MVLILLFVVNDVRWIESTYLTVRDGGLEFCLDGLDLSSFENGSLSSGAFFYIYHRCWDAEVVRWRV